MVGTTIQAQSQFDTLGTKEREHLKKNLGEGAAGIMSTVPDEFVVASDNSKGYQLLKAMGFKERGGQKFVFKSYESPDEEEEEVDLDHFEDHVEAAPSKKVYGAQMPDSVLP